MVNGIWIMSYGCGGRLPPLRLDGHGGLLAGRDLEHPFVPPTVSSVSMVKWLMVKLLRVEGWG